MMISKERIVELLAMTKEEFKQTKEYETYQGVVERVLFLFEKVVKRIASVINNVLNYIESVVEKSVKRELARIKMKANFNTPLDTRLKSQFKVPNIPLSHIRSRT